ncbi:MAG TPA: bifunctional hydroxymethylpyrimidine kinase/phosphomethylpyrimidine kinase [Mariprofundaceae bacterium]|nr:bifunctional hydroxymethylpyrimidine kinase/phosphomethylpyrimidine kinase [Mariprofundaceae bacterium]
MTSAPACLAIGGSDSCAGAGIQADLATFTRAGVKGCSAITALTAQNPDRIDRIEPVAVAQLEAEMLAIFDYYKVAAVKTGMLLDAAHVHCVAELLARRHTGRPLVVDPVMVASSGKQLLDDTGIATLTDELFPLATLITPNLPEAARLLGRSNGDLVEDAAELAVRYRTAVLLKGGHREDEAFITDILVSGDGDVQLFTHAKQAWDPERSHGTGCRLAAAIAAGLAIGRDLAEAIGNAIELV